MSELARTDSLKGYKSLEFVKQWMIENNIKTIEGCDSAFALPCAKEGALCHHEALHRLSSVCRLSCGKGFYEKAGGEPDEGEKENQDYRIAADFIHQFVRASYLISDCKRLEQTIPEATAMIDLLDRSIQVTQSEETARISEIFNRLLSKVDQDVTTHALYHDFLDRMLNDKDSLFVDVLGYMLFHRDQYEPELLEICSTGLIDFVDGFLKRITQESEAGKDGEDEELRRQQIRNIREIFESHVNKSVSGDSDDEDDHFLPGRSLKLRAHSESKKKMWMQNFIGFSDRFEEIYYLAKAYVSLKEEETDFNPEDYFVKKFNECLEGHSKVAEFPPGQMYMMWKMANFLTRGPRDFVFKNPHYQGT